ncbi:hypothetical protein NL676_006378 [Syzygium grande]|nr:hypothetical protein NL676_006378 [Syzygium grande]
MPLLTTIEALATTVVTAAATAATKSASTASGAIPRHMTRRTAVKASATDASTAAAAAAAAPTSTIPRHMPKTTTIEAGTASYSSAPNIGTPATIPRHVANPAAVKARPGTPSAAPVSTVAVAITVPRQVPHLAADIASGATGATPAEPVAALPAAAEPAAAPAAAAVAAVPGAPLTGAPSGPVTSTAEYLPSDSVTTKNSTSSPSARLRNPSDLMEDWWTKRSSPPSLGLMKPNPLTSLNHSTVPTHLP